MPNAADSLTTFEGLLTDRLLDFDRLDTAEREFAAVVKDTWNRRAEGLISSRYSSRDEICYEKPQMQAVPRAVRTPKQGAAATLLLGRVPSEGLSKARGEPSLSDVKVAEQRLVRHQRHFGARARRGQGARGAGLRGRAEEGRQLAAKEEAQTLPPGGLFLEA